MRQVPASALPERIRAAAHAAADTVPLGSSPPLRLPAETWLEQRGGVAARRGRWAHRFGPVAVAAAVAAVVLAAVAVGGALHFARSAQPAASGTGGPGGPLTAGPPASWYVAADGVPAYYIALTANGNAADVPSYAVVRATATGATLGTIKPSLPGDTIVAVTAAADDRTFVLDEEKWGRQSLSFQPYTQTRSFYLVHLDSSGRPSTPAKLPITAVNSVTGVALSPDGTRLAIAVEQPISATTVFVAELRIYELATGAVRTWHGSGHIYSAAAGGATEDHAGSISWTADGRLLEFDWLAAPYLGPADGAWLLNTELGGSSLIGDSHQVVSNTAAYTAPSPVSTTTSGPSPAPSATSPALPFSSVTCSVDWSITGDGSAVICGRSERLTAATKPPYRGTVETAFYEYSTVTGKLVHVLGHWTIKNANELLAPSVLWSSPSGDVIIGAIPGTGSTRVGIISGNHFTLLATIPMPNPVAFPVVAAAW